MQKTKECDSKEEQTTSGMWIDSCLRQRQWVVVSVKTVQVGRREKDGWGSECAGQRHAGLCWGSLRPGSVPVLGLRGRWESGTA